MKKRRQGLTGSNKPTEPDGSNTGLTGSNTGLTDKLKDVGVDLDGNKVTIDSKPREYIPRYNPRVHKQGDKVMVNGQVVIVPELDAEGSPLG